jgi:hypothetical protein
MPGTATYIVYRTAAGDGQIRRTSDDKDILPAGQTFESAFQTALDRVVPGDPFSGGPGDIYVPAGQYDLTDEFSGFVVSSYTNLRLDGRAQLRVPPNYAGAVFQLPADDGANLAGVTNSSIVGGRITERAPEGGQAGANWTAFLLKGSAKDQLTGVFFNKVAETEISLASVGISIVVNELKGFVNSNTFEFLRMQNCRNFVSFEMAALDFQTGIPVWANRFTDLQLECNTTVRTTIGIRNVVGRQQEFDSVKVWDIQRGTAAPGKADPLTIEISAQAEKTLIIGGILAGGFVAAQNVEDKGAGTTVLP